MTYNNGSGFEMGSARSIKYDTYFVYVSGNMGMKSNGSFTKNQTQWVYFNQADLDHIGNNKPYGATRTGMFIAVSNIKRE